MTSRYPQDETKLTQTTRAANIDTHLSTLELYAMTKKNAFLLSQKTHFCHIFSIIPNVDVFVKFF